MTNFNEFFTIECPHCGVLAAVSKSAYSLGRYNWLCHGCRKPFTLYKDEDKKLVLVKKYKK